MIDEINASKDLTDKEKQEAISKLNQLKRTGNSRQSTCTKYR